MNIFKLILLNGAREELGFNVACLITLLSNIALIFNETLEEKLERKRKRKIKNSANGPPLTNFGHIDDYGEELDP